METDEEAEKCQADVNMDDLRSTDLIDVWVLVVKRLIKMEIWEFYCESDIWFPALFFAAFLSSYSLTEYFADEDVAPLRPYIALVSVVLVAAATWYFMREDRVVLLEETYLSEIQGLKDELAQQRALLRTILQKVSDGD